MGIEFGNPIDGVKTLVDSKKREEAFDIINEYGSELDKNIAVISASVGFAATGTAVIVTGAYVAPTVIPAVTGAVSSAATATGTWISTTATGIYTAVKTGQSVMPSLSNSVNTVAVNSDKILSQGDVAYNSITTIKNVFSGNWGEVPNDILYTAESIFTERYITATARNKNLNYDVDVDSLTSKYDDNLTSKYNGNITSKYEGPEIKNSMNNPNAGVGGAKLLPEPQISPRRAAALEKQRIAAQGSSGSGKIDFIVTENGTVMPTNKDFNLVDANTPTNMQGDWFQIHNTHGHGSLGTTHTHYPEINTYGNVGSTVRRDISTTAEHIDKADSLIRSGAMRERINRKDLGGPVK